jgi:hypothetical protein
MLGGGDTWSKSCVEKLKHVFCFVEVDHLEGGGKPCRRSEQTTREEGQTMQEVKSCAKMANNVG